MQNFHIKSILLGLGMGVILTALVSIIFIAGSNPAESKPSKDEIIQMAKGYGLVDPADLIKSQDNKTATNQNEDDSSIKISLGDNSDTSANSQAEGSETTVPAENTNSGQKSDNSNTAQKNPEAKEISIQVNPGDTGAIVAAKLFDAGLIKSKTDFINKLIVMGLVEKINVGDFKIKTGTDDEEIIKILTTIH